MRKITKEESRKINGGRWKCKDCGAKFWVYVLAKTHQNCTAHYSGVGFCL